MRLAVRRERSRHPAAANGTYLLWIDMVAARRGDPLCQIATLVEDGRRREVGHVRHKISIMKMMLADPRLTTEGLQAALSVRPNPLDGTRLWDAS